MIEYKYRIQRYIHTWRGYNAKRLINCMFLSSLILIANVITVRVINISGAGEYIFVLEFIFFIIVHKILP